MMRVAFLFIALLIAPPANAGCFLFFCAHRHHHVQHRYQRHVRVVHKIVVQHKTTVKKVIVVRDRKAQAPMVPAVDSTPIAPLK